MIFLFVLYHIFLHDSVVARPLPPSHSISEISFYPREIDSNRFTQRNEWNIVWNCFATIFACSWVAIHPNIPAQSDSSKRIFFRRLMIMAYMLIVPEYVILWAGRQWYAARNIAKKHKNRGWTSTTHGFFASMGGFTLYENGVVTETLVIERLEELESKGKIDWPSISEKEIEDRSKGDVFSKTFAVLQTTWFVTQCIARGAYGLVITELEVATLAFSVLNGLLYFLWWNKPLGVACPVPVYLISSKQEAGTQTRVSDDGATPDHAISSIISNTSYTTTVTTNVPVALKSGNKKFSNKDDLPLESTPLKRLSSTLFQLPFAFARYWVKFKDIVLLVSFGFSSHLTDMVSCTAIDGGPALSIPTFYAPSCGASRTTRANRSIFIGAIIGTLFGGIHCIAWSFNSFPSVQQKYVWRASAATITFIPSSYLVVLFGVIAIQWGKRSEVDWISRFVDRTIGSIASWILNCSFFRKFLQLVVGLAMIVIGGGYLVSRAALLILPLIALRSLPPESLLNIDWSSFIPHV